MPVSDHELIVDIRAGDNQAFRHLVERHTTDALRLAMRLLAHKEEAEEAVQDAFVRVYKSINSFRSDSSFTTWFYCIVYNVCLTRIARRRTLHSMPFTEWTNLSIEEEAQSVPDKDRPDTLVEGAELSNVIQQGIENIPLIYRGVFTLFFTQELGYEEIVEITNLPLNTVKSRLFRARKLLRDHVKAYLHEK